MIVVLDTNIFLSAFLTPRGNAAEILRRWEKALFEVGISPALLDELARALDYTRISKHLKLSGESIQTLLRQLRTVAVFVEPVTRVDVIPQDPDDNRVLECALAASASYIITGDRHLLEFKEFQGIVILPPAAFLTLLDLGS